MSRVLPFEGITPRGIGWPWPGRSLPVTHWGKPSLLTGAGPFLAQGRRKAGWLAGWLGPGPGPEADVRRGVRPSKRKAKPKAIGAMGRRWADAMREKVCQRVDPIGEDL